MLRIKILILALLFSGGAFSQLLPVLPLRIGVASGGVNNYVFVDSATARPATTNTTVVATPARNYTRANFLIVQTVDYPLTANQPATLTDNKGNTYVNLTTDVVNFQRVRHWKCYNPNLSGGNVVITYASTGGVFNYATIFAEGYSGLLSDPGFTNNSAKTTATVASIGTGTITTTTANTLLVTTFASATTLTVAPTVSGSFSTSDRINWYPGANSRSQYCGTYVRPVTSTGSYSATHTSGGGNMSTETIGTIIAYQ